MGPAVIKGLPHNLHSAIPTSFTPWPHSSKMDYSTLSICPVSLAALRQKRTCCLNFVLFTPEHELFKVRLYFYEELDLDSQVCELYIYPVFRYPET